MATLIVMWKSLIVFDVILKSLTGLVSVATAVFLWFKISRLLTLPTTSSLEGAIRDLLDVQDALEQKVVAHSHALIKSNSELTRLNIELKKQAETSERHAIDLARSNEELEQFAYIASHDLQEPLRAISIHMSLLSKRYSKHLDDKADEHIRFAVDGATRMQALINDILTFSRIRPDTTGKVQINTQKMISDIVTSKSALIRSNDATIDVDALPNIFCYPEMIKQVFQNLISNALKFRRSDAPKIHISCANAGSSAIFCVKDNGIGIDPKHFERIFLIFQRLHTREKYPGTGLGLAICKKIATLHGGRIWVESKQGLGSQFFFQVPIGESDVASSAKEGD